MFFKSVADTSQIRSKLAALEAVQANIMVADPELRIIYVNPAAMALMAASEADMVKELPRFSTKTLVGSNIDVFHKRPEHQRGMLARLDRRHEATIKVGPQTFDLVVTPLSGEGGERIGFVVEWADARHRLLNLDFAAQIAAIGRSQAIIQFTTDGVILEANTNFLDLLGYTLPELKGQHHRIFVEPGYAGSPAYAEFWNTLRSGKCLAGQYKRVGKNGKQVWIEGSYNPILDEHGRVTKVVKFAFDISAQRNLLASLQVSLDQVEKSAAVSNEEAGRASEASAETASNVQSVAASAEQLAASTQEIAGSMAKSRHAAEDVAAQASAVGSSTEAMATAAQAMNGIVGLIRSVASQINLLALNATIEAARAGDAGKGFAVVASEVKNLAIQAAKATEQITSEIDGLQSISADVARAIVGIRESVGTVREQVTLTASAVEEQTAVTHGMSASMQSAAAAVGSVDTSIGAIVAAVREVTKAVAATSEASKVLAR